MPARSQYSEGPATGHLGTGFSWFPCVYKQMLRGFPTFQVATTCFSCSPPDLNLLDPYFIFVYMHNNHRHRVATQLQLNILLLYYYILVLFNVLVKPSLHNNIITVANYYNYLAKQHVSALLGHHQAYKTVVLVKVH